MVGCAQTQSLLQITADIAFNKSLTHCVLFIEKCGCQLYKHFKFPKDDESSALWAKLINRKMSDTNNDLWKPSENSVVCSIHFADNQPTPSNPWPTLHLGYDARENLRSLERRKPRVKPVTTPSASTSTSIPCSTQQNIL